MTIDSRARDAAPHARSAEPSASAGRAAPAGIGRPAALRALLLGLLAALAAPAAAPSADPDTPRPAYTVTLDLARITSPAPLRPGLIHGFQIPGPRDARPPRLPDSLARLQPGFWGLGQFAFERYREVARFSPKIGVGLQSLYYDSKGSFAARPWQEGPDWAAKWERFCADQVRRSQREHKPVDYWSIWNEPDSPEFGGSWSQLLELARSASRGVRSVDPHARVVGGGVADFDHIYACRPDADCNPAVSPADPGDARNQRKDLLDFIGELARPPYDTRLDAIEWHEFTNPEHIEASAAKLAAFLRDPARFAPPYEAEWHVGEFGNSVNQAIPGFLIAFIDSAERAGIRWLSRACWDTWEERPGNRWSGCWQGLNGLYLRDLQTRQQIYYAQRAYAELTRSAAGYTRVATSSSDRHIHALAGRSDSSQKVYALIGLYRDGGGSLDPFPLHPSVSLVLAHYPYGSAGARVTLRKIAPQTSWTQGIAEATRGSGPLLVYSGDAPIEDGTVRVSIPPHADADAVYVLEVSAAAEATPPAKN